MINITHFRIKAFTIGVGGTAPFMLITRFKNEAVDFGQRPRPLHGRYTRTDTCVLASVGECQFDVYPLIFSVSLLKPLFSGFRSETAIWIQKCFKIYVGTSRRL
jgi:hypothetical protein